MSYPAGFAEYLRHCHNGSLPFEPDDYVLQVQKNVYGLRDAGKVWYRMISSILIDELGFRRSPLDNCLFVHATTTAGLRSVCVLALYVDDILLAGCPRLVKDISAALHARLPLHKGGDDYLGLSI
ncbi:MAG: reverse transcriptase domain-containing protein, partial [Rhodothermales bacterium]